MQTVTTRQVVEASILASKTHRRRWAPIKFMDSDEIRVKYSMEYGVFSGIQLKPKTPDGDQSDGL